MCDLEGRGKAGIPGVGRGGKLEGEGVGAREDAGHSYSGRVWVSGQKTRKKKQEKKKGGLTVA